MVENKREARLNRASSVMTWATLALLLVVFGAALDHWLQSYRFERCWESIFGSK
jgi:hypothetical protein